MRKNWVFILIILAIISMACTVSGVNVDFGRIEGTGVVVSETRLVGSDFSEVVLSGIGNLYIEQGAENSITIEAEENILPKIITRINGNRLVIDIEHGMNIIPTKNINYYVTVQELEAIQVSGAGNLSIMESLQTDSLKINLSGFGSVEIDDIETDDLDIVLSGAGDIDVAGVTDQQSIRISGAGNYRADDLHSQDADVIVSGLGNATVWVDQNLSVVISGGGNIDYYGNPQTKRTISGLGSLRSLGDHD